MNECEPLIAGTDEPTPGAGGDSGDRGDSGGSGVGGDSGDSGRVGGVWRRRWEAASRRSYVFGCPLLGWRVPILRDVAELRGRCRAVLGRWSARLAGRRMRQAVDRGSIGAADVLMIMDELHTAAEWSAPGPGSGAAASGQGQGEGEVEVEVVLPGTERDVEVGRCRLTLSKAPMVSALEAIT